jgi:hypothetical protein
MAQSKDLSGLSHGQLSLGGHQQPSEKREATDARGLTRCTTQRPASNRNRVRLHLGMPSDITSETPSDFRRNLQKATPEPFIFALYSRRSVE